eukprot:12951648-Heterocapsa_arctica.AAC.1
MVPAAIVRFKRRMPLHLNAFCVATCEHTRGVLGRAQVVSHLARRQARVFRLAAPAEADQVREVVQEVLQELVQRV